MLSREATNTNFIVFGLTPLHHRLIPLHHHLTPLHHRLTPLHHRCGFPDGSTLHQFNKNQKMFDRYVDILNNITCTSETKGHRDNNYLPMQSVHINEIIFGMVNLVTDCWFLTSSCTWLTWVCTLWYPYQVFKFQDSYPWHGVSSMSLL